MDRSRQYALQTARVAVVFLVEEVSAFYIIFIFVLVRVFCAKKNYRGQVNNEVLKALYVYEKKKKKK